MYFEASFQSGEKVYKRNQTLKHRAKKLISGTKGIPDGLHYTVILSDILVFFFHFSLLNALFVRTEFKTFSPAWPVLLKASTDGI